MIVVDASIIVKTVLDEPDSEQATAFLRREGSGIRGPDILTLEVCRAWVAAANARRLAASLAREASRSWLESVGDGRIRLLATDARTM